MISPVNFCANILLSSKIDKNKYAKPLQNLQTTTANNDVDIFVYRVEQTPNSTFCSTVICDKNQNITNKVFNVSNDEQESSNYIDFNDIYIKNGIATAGFSDNIIDGLVKESKIDGSYNILEFKQGKLRNKKFYDEFSQLTKVIDVTIINKHNFVLHEAIVENGKYVRYNDYFYDLENKTLTLNTIVNTNGESSETISPINATPTFMQDKIEEVVFA